jgi:stage II sporulation protein GA (sporulation sigma-E factor processing peptidase)
LVVYADLIFLLNGYIDFLLLWLTSGIRKQRTAMWRLLLAALLGGCYSMLHLWVEFAVAYFFPVKILVSMVMVWIAYPHRHPLAYLRNLAVFYLVCFITGGAMIALHYIVMGDSQVAGGIFFTQSSNGWGSPVSWVVVLIGFPLVWAYTKFSLRSLHERQTFHQFLVSVKILLLDQVITCTGLIDTGNQLRDPITRVPVMMVELTQLEASIPEEMKELILQKAWEKGGELLPLTWVSRMRIIPYRVAGRDGEMMVAFKPDQVEIYQKGKWHNVGKVLIGIDAGRLSSDGTYQALIHPACLLSSVG